MDLGAATHTGYVRAGNEDGFFASREHAVFAVADGMGGHEHGEVASHLALEAIIAHADALSHATPTELPTLLHQAIQDANTAILSQAINQDARNRMGTTLVLATICQDRLYFAHLGDSRLYLLRGELFTQLTRDHSLVQAMVDRGEITPEEAAIHPLRHQITRVVGSDDQVAPEIASQALESGDIILLCTDGLSGPVSGDLVKTILSTSRGAQEKADGLVKAALNAGGPDNVTALVIAYQQPRSLLAMPQSFRAHHGLPHWRTVLATLAGIVVLAALMLGWYLAHPSYCIAANTRGVLGVYKHWTWLPMLGKEALPVLPGYTLTDSEAKPLLAKYEDIANGIPVKDVDAGVSLLQNLANQMASKLVEDARKEYTTHGDRKSAQVMVDRAKALGADARQLQSLEALFKLRQPQTPPSAPRESNLPPPHK